MVMTKIKKYHSTDFDKGQVCGQYMWWCVNSVNIAEMDRYAMSIVMYIEALHHEFSFTVYYRRVPGLSSIVNGYAQDMIKGCTYYI